MTVLIYVNNAKQVGEPERLKVFANEDAAETWFEKNDPEGSPLSMRSWSKGAALSISSVYALLRA